jgi:nitrogen fixation NifU-like protein
LNKVSEKLTEELLELMRKCGYSEKVIDYFKNKVNMGRMENADWVSEHTGSCGDTLQIYLKINNGVIEDVKFLYVGCPGVGASASAMTNMVKNKTIEEAKKITEKDVLENLGGLPESKLDCVKLTVTAMRRTIAEYMALGPFKPNEIGEK